MNRKSVDGYAGMSIGRLKSVLLGKARGVRSRAPFDDATSAFFWDHHHPLTRRGGQTLAEGEEGEEDEWHDPLE